MNQDCFKTKFSVELRHPVIHNVQYSFKTRLLIVNCRQLDTSHEWITKERYKIADMIIAFAWEY